MLVREYRGSREAGMNGGPWQQGIAGRQTDELRV